MKVGGDLLVEVMQIDRHIYKSKVNFKDPRSSFTFKIPRKK